MAAFEVGLVCIKTVGREEGGYCVVLGKENQSFVMITGPRLLTGVKRRRCNVNHLQPTEHKLDVKENASDEDVITAYKKAGLTTKLSLKKPSMAEMKGEKQKVEEKAVKKAEKKEKTKKESKKKK
jgi:large subunit ribosomal protein L14e